MLRRCGAAPPHNPSLEPGPSSSPISSPKPNPDPDTHPLPPSSHLSRSPSTLCQAWGIARELLDTCLSLYAASDTGLGPERVSSHTPL